MSLKEFTKSSARPLPVIILADVSGSMSVNGKISSLNEAIGEMIKTFAEEENTRAEIHVAVITFGGVACLHQNLEPASKMEWKAMTANGSTPMGGAFKIAKEMIEDQKQIQGRAYRPTVILVSDGLPDEGWEESLAALLKSERASKATRFAMGIGEDADVEMLKKFLNKPESRVFEAHEARQIKQFFRWVTMSISSRSRSANPNEELEIQPDNLDDFDY